MPNIIFDFKRGGAGVAEILYGTVTMKPTLAHARGTSFVLPAPTTWDLIDGKATATNIQASPVPNAENEIEWGYVVTAKDNFGKSFEWLVGVPDAAGDVNFTALPRYYETKPPLFGEGPEGPAGEAATVDVGTVTGGETASITNTGTPENAVLDFVLPKGDKGDKGDSSTYYAQNFRMFSDPPSSYPNGLSTFRGQTATGWDGATGVTTFYSGAQGTGLQILKTYANNSVPKIRWANGGTADTWGEAQPLLPGLATQLLDGLMSSADKTKLDNMLLATDTKNVNDAPSTYPSGISITRGSTVLGWPNEHPSGGVSSDNIITLKADNVNGGVIQFVRDYFRNYAPLKVRFSDAIGAWSDFITLASREEIISRLPVNFLDYGGVADGVTDNSAALTAFITMLNGDKREGYIPQGDYVIKSTVVAPAGSSGWGLFGDGKRKTKILFRPDGVPTGATMLTGVGVTDMTLRDIQFDGGRSIHGVRGHAISFRNAESCEVDRLFIRDHGYAAIILFANNIDASIYGRNYIRDTVSDGLNDSDNGFLFVNMEGCYFINVTAKNGGQNAHNTPSSGVQFKNRCTNCHMVNVASYGYKDGIGLGGDTDDFGPTNNTVLGYAYNCHISLSMGSAVGNQIQIHSTGATRNDVRLAANNSDNFIDAYIDANPKSEASIYFGSNFNTVNLKYMPNGITKLATFVVGSRYNKLLVESRYASSGQNITTLVENLSEQTSNYVGSYDSIYRTSTLTPDGSTALYFFDPSGKQNYVAHQGSNQLFSFRSDGTNIFTVQPTMMAAGTDNLMSLGSTSRRFTQLYAVSGTINTSDEREKRDISTELSPELRAWAKVDFVKFKWKEAVDKKGKKARWHFGVIAQDVKRAFESEGLDPFEYGILCYDEWEEQAEVVDEEGKVVEDYQASGNRYGVRYEEALALESAYLRSQLIK